VKVAHVVKTWSRTLIASLLSPTDTVLPPSLPRYSFWVAGWLSDTELGSERWESGFESQSQWALPVSVPQSNFSLKTNKSKPLYGVEH